LQQGKLLRKSCVAKGCRMRRQEPVFIRQESVLVRQV
jgi:hypothetical protein